VRFVHRSAFPGGICARVVNLPADRLRFVGYGALVGGFAAVNSGGDHAASGKEADGRVAYTASSHSLTGIW
jgi:hypothetical protein